MKKVLAAASVALTLAGPGLAESLPTLEVCPVKVYTDAVELEDIGPHGEMTRRYMCRTGPLPRPVDLFKVDPETEESKG